VAGVDLGKLFGRESAAGQLLMWSVLSALISAVLAPELELVQREVFKALPSTPLTPAQLADMVVRHIVSGADGASYARESGIAAADFQRMVESAGEGLGPADLAEALRRGIIPAEGTGPDAVSFEQGMAEAHTRDKWADTVRKLSVKEPSPIDPLEALLQGQLTEDVAKALYVRFGGDPEHFTWLFNSRGQAPTPVELLELANRGIIPWDGVGPDKVSYEQGFLEGPARNKWEGPFRALGEYVVPPRSITAMVRSGALDDAAALREFRKSGMTQEMAAAMLADAHHAKLAAPRDLAKGTIDQLYRDRLVSAEQATAMYRSLDYTDAEIPFLLQLQDMQRAVAAVNQAVGRVHTLYVSRHVSKQQAVDALGALAVPAAQQQDLLASWDIERAVNVKTLTAAEIASAHYYKIIDQDQALAQLVAIGYTPWRAWVLLSVRAHAKLPAQPSPDPEE